MSGHADVVERRDAMVSMVPRWRCRRRRRVTSHAVRRTVGADRTTDTPTEPSRPGSRRRKPRACLENVASSRPVSSRESQRQSGGRASPARVEATFQRGDDGGRAGTRGRSRGSSSARLAGVREFVREFVRVFVREFVRSSAEGEHGDDDRAEARVDVVDWRC